MTTTTPRRPTDTRVTPAAKRRRPWRRWLRWRWWPLVGAVVVVAAGVLLYVNQRAAEDTAADAQDVASAAVAEKVTLAEQIKAACASGELEGPICQRADQAAAQPVPPPAPPRDGNDGDPGRGITNTDVNDAGDLIIFYTDGTSENVGHVVGRQGGMGPAGRGVAGSDIVDGRLVITYTDGQVVDLGPVVGRDGRDGRDGADSTVEGPAGRGVADVDQVDGRLVVTYTDGTTDDAGPLPVADPPEPPDPPEQTAMWCPPGESPQQITYGVGGPSGTACVAS